MLRLPAKRTDEVLDYAIDWGPRLSADTIATNSAAPATSGALTVDRSDVDGAVQTFWLSGGQRGVHSIVCTVTTVGGRTLQEVVQVTVEG